MTLAFVTRYEGGKKKLVLTGKSIVQQFYDAVMDSLYHDAYDYNNLGDSYRVPDEYAEACMTVENIRMIQQAYSQVTDKVTNWGYQKYYAQSYREGGCSRRITGFDYDDWDSEYQKNAHRCHKKLREKENELILTIQNLEPTDFKDSIITIYENYSTIRTKFIIVTGFDDCGAEDKRTRYKDMTFAEQEMAQEQAYWDSLSDEEKQKEEEYAQPDMTYMRENGFTSFSCSDDGTVSYWR